MKLNYRELAKKALEKEINLAYLEQYGTGSVYRPKMSYEKLCKSLLKHKNIEIKEMKITELREFLIARHKNMEFAITDNRIDYLCNYAHGNFDRVKFESKSFKDPNMEEFIDISEGIVFTPTKEYFCVSKEEGIITKITCRWTSTSVSCTSVHDQSSI